MRVRPSTGAVLAAAVLLLTAIAPSASAATGRSLFWWGNAPIPDGLAEAISFDVAAAHGLAAMPDGSVVQWGSDPCWIGDVPAGLSSVAAVSAAGCYNLALKSDGTVVSWDFNGYYSPPAGLAGVKAIAAGDAAALALKTDGTVVAWGAWGEIAVPPGFASDVTAIAAGGPEIVAIKTDGTVVEWGYSTPPAGLSGVVALAVGDAWEEQYSWPGGTVVALKSDGTVVAWGNDDHGQATVPAGLSSVIAIAAGTYHSLALKSDGTVVGWGLDDYEVVSGPGTLTGVSAIVAGGQDTIAFVGATYPFTGFFAPVDNNTMNVAKAGAAIPVKFSLGGDQGLDIFNAGYPKAVRISCASGEQTDVVDEYVAVSTSGLKYDAATGRYQYNWKTAKNVTGCFRLQLGLKDGSPHSADFQLN